MGPNGTWAQTGPAPKWFLGPNGPWAQTGPGPKRALGPMGPGPNWAGPNGLIYGRSEHCDEDLQKEISKAFASLPQETAVSLLSQFSAKQQQKAQRIIQEAAIK